MSPEELRAAVRERLASRWPGVVVTFEELADGPIARASIEVHAQATYHASPTRDVLDAAMIAHALDMGMRAEVSRRGLYAAVQEAVEAKKA